MSRMTRRELIAGIGGMLGFGLLPKKARATDNPFSCGLNLKIPISVAAGSFRTPPFSVGNEWYVMRILAKRKFPTNQMNCMLGLEDNPLRTDQHCYEPPLLQFDWLVWDGDQLITQGSVRGFSSKDYNPNKGDMQRMIEGGFQGKRRKKYVVELRFAKDGGELQQTDPHLLIYEYHDSFWCPANSGSVIGVKLQILGP